MKSFPVSRRRLRHSKARRAAFSRSLRPTYEQLEIRTLMASDVAPTFGTIALPSDELVQREQAFYASLGTGGAAAGLAFAPLSDTFRLHSRPSATKTIYLDFDGATVVGTSWNTQFNRQTIVSPPWDPAGNGAAFTDVELLQIQQAWLRTAADFAAFDVNVTTEDPGELALVNTGGNDTRWGIRVINTLVNFSGLPVGGFAFFDSFNWNYESIGATDTPAYVFNPTSMTVAAAVTHEAGHAINLAHDGTTAANPVQPSAEYYDGHGTGENSWGPIMGSGYYRNVTTWSNGNYIGANNFQDDLTVITTRNGFGYVPDDHASSFRNATTIASTASPTGIVTLSQLGKIERNSDTDAFRFQTGTGPVKIDINPYILPASIRTGPTSFSTSVESTLINTTDWTNNQGSNLDVEARLFDANGVLVATSNPDGLRAGFDLTLNAGTYFVVIDGVGFGDPFANPPTGYTDYASLGDYQITGTVAISLEMFVPSTPITYVENSNPVQVTSTSSVLDFTSGDFGGAQLEVTIDPFPGTYDRLSFVPDPADNLSVTTNLVMNAVGATIATVNASNPRQVRFGLLSTTSTADIEALIRGVQFSAEGDAPETFARGVEFRLTKGQFTANSIRPVNIVTLPDKPLVVPTKVNDIFEDALINNGTLVSVVMTNGIRDPDQKDGVGIVIVGKENNFGSWQYSPAPGEWYNITNPTTGAGLVLGPTTYLRFVPPRDFFGTSPRLMYHGLDELYNGLFTTSSNVVTVDVNAIEPTGVISTASSFITQSVLPVNDPPVANFLSQRVSFTEDAIGSVELPLGMFRDVDDAVVSLSIRAAQNETVPSWLVFNPTTRVLSGTPRNEDVGIRNLLIVGTDGSNAIASIPLFVEVINTNDPPLRVSLEATSIPENSKGVRVGTFTTVDVDAADSFTYSIDDNRFFVQGNILFTKSTADIDYEDSTSIRIGFTATDSGNPPMSVSGTFELQVTNVNEFAPEFATPPEFTIPESVAPGAWVGRLNAVDADANSVLAYEQLSPESPFTIDPATGDVYVKPLVQLDRETLAEHRFLTRVSDGQFGTIVTSVSVVLSDVNEFSPEFITTTIVVPENQGTVTPFARIEARDADLDTGIRFSILSSDLPPFDLNPVNGEMIFRPGSRLNFETRSSYALVVEATDQGTPARSTTKTIAVTVSDVNESPTSATVSPNSVLSSITGIQIGTLTIHDEDANSQYHVESVDSRFEVSNGILRLRKGRALAETDPTTINVALRVSEKLPNGAVGPTQPLSVSFTRVSNPRPWQNRSNPLNVDRDEAVTSLDVLAIVNATNKKFKISDQRSIDDLELPDFDVDGDNLLTSLDVLAVSNALNASKRAGEGSNATIQSRQPAKSPEVVLLEELAWAQAFSQLENDPLFRRRR